MEYDADEGHVSSRSRVHVSFPRRIVYVVSTSTPFSIVHRTTRSSFIGDMMPAHVSPAHVRRGRAARLTREVTAWSAPMRYIGLMLMYSAQFSLGLKQGLSKTTILWLIN